MTMPDLGYTIGQRVEIHEPGHLGNVEAITLDRDGITYRVTFWIDGKRETLWLYPYELRAIQKVTT